MAPADDDWKRFGELADELGLTDDGDDVEEGKRKKERTNFLNSAMARKGYKPKMSWDEPDPPKGKEGEGKSDFFGGGQY